MATGWCTQLQTADSKAAYSHHLGTKARFSKSPSMTTDFMQPPDWKSSWRDFSEVRGGGVPVGVSGVVFVEHVHTESLRGKLLKSLLRNPQKPLQKRFNEEACPSIERKQKGGFVKGRFRRMYPRSGLFRGAESMVMKFHGNVRGEVRVNFLALFASKPHIFMCGGPQTVRNCSRERSLEHCHSHSSFVPNLWYRGTCACTLVPVFGTWEHLHVPSFRLVVPGNIRQDHPFRNHPFANPR